MEILKLAPAKLRWKCDESILKFDSTAEVNPASKIIGQDSAREALEFGLLCNAPGQNIYVRGSRGTGRLTMVMRLIKELSPTTNGKRDYAYVHNFKHSDRPRLIALGPGLAREFKQRISELAKFIDDGLVRSLDTEPVASKRLEMKQAAQSMIAEISGPLEKDLAENNMALISVQQGPVTAPVIVPLVEGAPIPPDTFMEMVKSGTADKEQLEKFKQNYPEFQKRLADVGKLVNEAWRSAAMEIDSFNQQAARNILEGPVNAILQQFGSGKGVREFIDDIIDDAVTNRLNEKEAEDDNDDLTELYGVNVVLTHSVSNSRPVVEEATPNAMNLLGTVEQKAGPGGVATSDYRGIRAGAILNADQGYLILNAEDLLGEPGAYQSLMRTLRTGRLEIIPQESSWMRPYIVVQPEPIEIQVRVILIGDVSTWYKLDHYDADFRELFKVLADFDDELPRDESGVMQYAAVLSHLAESESLPHFERSAVAALAEHGARVVARGDKLTARFGRIADIAREAAFLASQGIKASLVTGENVYEAVRRTKKRASLPSKKFQDLIDNETIIVKTDGRVVGQINGLAVMHSGPLTYGFPSRITSAIGPGRAGLVNIEGTARMSGAIHTKGFHILGGLLINLLKLPHPLAFSATLAFEQSYGGIDGDSASGAEIVCLLSALTGIPVRQDLAMTGAIDQHGNVEAIGGANEKIEGFFDVCNFRGLNGHQGVVIPKANAPDLMLRREIVDACRQNKFSVYAVDSIEQALEMMTGVPAGEFIGGSFAEGTLLNLAVRRAGEYWRQSLASPDRLTSVKRGESQIQISAKLRSPKG